MKKILFLILLCITISLSDHPLAGEKSSAGPFTVKKRDLCPICGMFVHKHPNWVAQIIFDDKTYAFFEGNKDMFKYYLDLKKYNPKKTRDDIVSFWVTSYYTTTVIDGRKAFYVVGSDVLGPMGRELIPHSSEKADRAFMTDHGGDNVLTFDQRDLNVVEALR